MGREAGSPATRGVTGQEQKAKVLVDFVGVLEGARTKLRDCMGNSDWLDKGVDLAIDLANSEIKGLMEGGAGDKEPDRIIRRELSGYCLTQGCDELLKVAAIGPRGPDNTNDEYEITIDPCVSQLIPVCVTRLKFQSGAAESGGLNGVTEEALLAIIIDRLRARGGNPSAEYHLKIALSDLLWKE